MLGSKYIAIAGNRIPNPTSFSEAIARDTRSYKDEAGNETLIVRSGWKSSISLEFNATSFLRDRLEALYTAGQTFTMTAGTHTYTRMYIEGFSAELAKNSERTPNTDGLWTVGLELRQL